MGSLANAFALLGVEQDHETSTIVAEVKKEVEEHKKIVAENKKIASQKKKVQHKKIAAQKKKAEAENKKIIPGHAVNGQRYVHNALQRPAIAPLSEDPWLAGEAQPNQQWLADREQWFANQQRWLARDAERKRDTALKTLKEYEEHKALEKQRKAEKSTSMSAPDTPPKEAIPDDFTTKQRKSKNGPARGLRGTQNSRKNLNNGNWAGYSVSKRNQDNALPHENNNTVHVEAEAAPAPDLTDTNFPVLGTVTKPTKHSVKHGRKDNAN